MGLSNVYRDVSLSGEEAEQLRQIAVRLGALADATGDRRWDDWADTLLLLHRRYERQEPFEVSPGVTLVPNLHPLEPSNCVAIARRPALRVIDGGAA